MRPGVEVAVLDTPPPLSAIADVGVWFVVGATERGRATRPQLIRNMTEYTQWFGTRQSYAVDMYDAADCYFNEGGSRMYVSRAVGPAATLATKTYNDAVAAPTFRVDAAGPGAWGATLKVGVTVVGSKFNVVVKDSTNGDAILEQSPDFNNKSEAIAWASSTSKYVDFVDLDVTKGNPATLAAALLVGGSDDIANVTQTQYQTALGLFGTALGPGQVSMPGRTASTTHSDLLAHAAANNRVAYLDAADTATVGTLTSAAATLRTNVNARYGGYFGPRQIMPGITQGTFREVCASAFVAALTSRLTSPNQAPAGSSGIARYVIRAKYDYLDIDRQTMNDAGISIVRNMLSGVRLYGFRSLADPFALAQWTQLTAARIIMFIKYSFLGVGENYAFADIDGRGQLQSQFKGDLTGVLIPLFESGQLFGDTADDAFNVDTGSSVNTPTTIQNGELHAAVRVKTSPFAELVHIDVIKQLIA